MKRFNKKQSGFTLLELLVVVSILAIIAGAVISAISGQEERAGQGVALNTMGALENATRQQVVLNGGLPSSLDSGICVTGTTLDGAANTGALVGAGTVELLGASATEDNNNDGEPDGGLASGLAAKVTLLNLPDYAAANVRDAGITSLRYVASEACDDNDATEATMTDGNVGDEEVGETLANILFWDVASGGAGVDVPLADGQGAPMMFLSDPTDIGQEPETIVGVFGVGNFSELSTGQNQIISRGPVDGNVEGNGAKYSHFSLAIKLGELDTGVALGQTGLDDSANTEYETDEMQIVAILDSDGDNFDDEIAEFAGLEDE